jgi:hypothetical protein
MATTTNYSWTTPDDTALVKDGAAAIRSLGTSIDTTTKALNPETTLGDLAYRSSSANVKTRLGIGTTGQILSVVGGVPAWASPSGAGANWTLVNAGGTALTGAATVTISGISNADKIMVLFEGASSALANGNIGVRLNGITTSSYPQYGSIIVGQTAYSAGMVQVINGNQNMITIGQTSGSANSAVNGFCLLSGCNSTGVKVYNAGGSGNAAGNTDHSAWNTGGFFNSSSVISSVSAFSSNGNFDNGTVFVYTSA